MASFIKSGEVLSSPWDWRQTMDEGFISPRVWKEKAQAEVIDAKINTVLQKSFKVCFEKKVSNSETAIFRNNLI